MVLLIDALAAMVVGAATLGSATAIGVAFGFATTTAYLFLPVLAPDSVSPWVIATATLALGGGAALWTRRHDDRSSRQVRAAVLTMAAAPALLAVLAVVSFASTTSLFRAGTYAALIGPVETVPFSQAIQRMDIMGHPVASDRTVIDQETVRQRRACSYLLTSISPRSVRAVQRNKAVVVCCYSSQGHRTDLLPNTRDRSRLAGRCWQ